MRSSVTLERDSRGVYPKDRPPFVADRPHRTKTGRVICFVGRDEFLIIGAASNWPAWPEAANDFLDSTDCAADTNLTDTAASATRVFSAPRGDPES